MEQKGSNAPCKWWDFTMFVHTEALSLAWPVSKVKDVLKVIADKYAFQLEAGESGKLHYQGRMRLKDKQRESTIYKSFPAHLSRSVCQNIETYVQKEETRVAGPWHHYDPVLTGDAIVIESKGMNAWQRGIWEILQTNDNRKVDVIIDEVGGKGKSSFSRYLGESNLACKMPYIGDADIMIKSLCAKISGWRSEGRADPKIVVIDVPRSTCMKAEHKFWAAVEMIKDGYLYETRYTFSEVYFTPPRVLVLMNQKPAVENLSKDRWSLWMVSPEGTLIVYKGGFGALRCNSTQNTPQDNIPILSFKEIGTPGTYNNSNSNN